MLKQDIKALLDRVALPKTQAWIEIPLPPYNSWEYNITAPCNGYVYVRAYGCTAICATNNSTGAMHYFKPGGSELSDYSTTLAVKKGDQLNLFIGGDASTVHNAACFYMPFEGQ